MHFVLTARAIASLGRASISMKELVVSLRLLESVDLLNGGEGYDILNPPIVGIETSTGIGAAVEPIIQGSVKEVFVDPQIFDIDAVQSISLTGGNGSGCLLQPILGTRNRELQFVLFIFRLI